MCVCVYGVGGVWVERACLFGVYVGGFLGSLGAIASKHLSGVPAPGEETSF